MLDRNSTVMVYNYRKCKVALPGASGDGYSFDPATDIEHPVAVPIKISDIQAIDSQSEIFRNKRLVIDPNDEKEVVKIVNLKYNENNIFSYEDMKEAVLNPTTETLMRIVEITDRCVLDDIHNTFLELRYSGEYLLSERVEQVLEARHSELTNGINVRKSGISLQEKKNEVKIANKIDSEIEITTKKIEEKIEDKKKETVKPNKTNKKG